MPIDAVLPQKKPKNICAEDFRGEFLLWLSGNPSEPAYGWAQTIDSMFSSPSLPAPINTLEFTQIVHIQNVKT